MQRNNGITDRDWFDFLSSRFNEIWRPTREEDRPNRQFLEWHAGTVFRQ